MKNTLDLLIINNVPSFYKINLYNELAKRCKIHVVFIALTDQVVINSSFQQDVNFSYELISPVQIDKRNRLKSFWRIYKTCRKYDYKKLIYGGYDDLEGRLLMFLTRKEKNCLQFESSIRESKVTGLVGLIKRIIFKRFSIVLPSGNLQTAVFEVLGYKGSIIKTKGVGIFNKSKKRDVQKEKLSTASLQYIAVSRLIPVKNLEFLIQVFNKLNKPLKIVGSGVLENTLKGKANPNILFTGFIDNNKIDEVYNSCDVFILPSISETWGLVVEEAIFYGLPVLISNSVGCQEEMVLKPQTGLLFSPIDEKSLVNSINSIEKNINFYRQNCMNFNFETRDASQIKAYLQLISV